MGSPEINSGGINEDSMKALVKYFPEYMRVSAAGIAPMEQAKLDAARQTAPGTAQLEYDNYAKYGPQFSAIGSDIAQQEAQRQAQTDLGLLSGPGGQIAQQLFNIQKQFDPEYFKMRENALGASNLLAGSMEDPNAPMSASERAEIDRSLARNNLARGNEAPTASSAVSDAMAYGRAGEDRKSRKQQNIASILGAQAGSAPAMQSGVDPGAAILGRNVINKGDSRLGQPQVPTGSDVMGAAGNMFNSFQTGGMQSAISNQNRKTAVDRTTEAIGAAGSFFSI